MMSIMVPHVQEAIMRAKEGPKFLRRRVQEGTKRPIAEAKKALAKAKKIKDADTRDALVSEIEGAIEGCQAFAAEVTEAAKTDLESAMDQFEEGVEEQCGRLADYRSVVEGLLNKSKFVKEIEKGIKQLKREHNRFTNDIKAGRFNGDLDAVGQLGQVIEALEDLVPQVKAERDPEALGDFFEQISSLFDDARDAAEAAREVNDLNLFDAFAPAGGAGVEE